MQRFLSIITYAALSFGPIFFLLFVSDFSLFILDLSLFILDVRGFLTMINEEIEGWVSG